MANLILKSPKNNINGAVELSGSKSISNRVLIIQKLCETPFEIENLSSSKDTQTLHRLLNESAEIYDAGHAGTTFRFLCSYFAFSKGTQILTGSKRMQERPIGPLVESLKSIGANIKFLKKEGFPPLEIAAPNEEIKKELSVSADISSQFVSSLALIAPSLTHGLTIHLNGEIVSKSYIEMTLSIMSHFGIKWTWKDQKIIIPAQKYKARDYRIEGDWSSASYLYGIVASHPKSKIKIKNLFQESVQGDSYLIHIMESFGVQTIFKDDHLTIENTESSIDYFEYDFSLQPDLVQTISVVAALKGVPCKFIGVKTLKIKETDRVLALQNELLKTGIAIEIQNQNVFTQINKAQIRKPILFATYDDHRMAMCLSLLSVIDDIEIEDYNVVEKSYPNFWNDLKHLGFTIQDQSSIS